MGKRNLAVNQLLERKEIFTDLINGSLFCGKEVIASERLELISGHTGIIQEKETGRLAALERYGDIRMEADMETYSIIFAEETQDSVDYTMPVRNMLYDALEYTKQIQQLEKQHKTRGERLERAEFLSGIKKDDKLKPVITLVLYCGERWGGSKSLYEMLEIDETREEAQMLRELLPDYRVHLIEPDRIEDMQVFQTCLQHIFNMVKYKSDKDKMYDYMREHREELQQMNYVETLAAFELLGESKRAERFLLGDEKGDAENMCKAFDGIVKDAEERGERRGEIRGEIRGEERGRELGEKRGRELGEKRFLSLLDAMYKNNCQDMISRVVQDSLYREQMYRQYNL